MKTEGKKRTEACDRIATALIQYSQGREHMSVMYGIIQHELAAHWESVKSRTYVIGSVQMMKQLVSRQWKPNPEGYWSHGLTNTFSPGRWIKCGKVKDNTYAWEDWMLEEIVINDEEVE